MGGPRSTEKYACDACRSSKVACTRESLHCSRCVEKKLHCVYSRSGIIRRRTSRKRNSNRASLNTSTPSLESATEALGSSLNAIESHLEDDVALTQQHLGGTSNSDPMNALSSLSNACSGFTLGTRRNVSDIRATGFHDMSEYGEVLVQALNNAGGATSSWLSDAPLDVKTHLQSGRPGQVHESAWLVMYYALLSNISVTQSLREKIHDNLWHALSDARILLEPSEFNIRAILMVLSEAVTVTTPTMCWMLASTACRMFSSLGSNLTRSSASAGGDQKRRTLFWHLNLMDKAFAIIFRKSPTFNRKMVREIGLPTIQDFLPAIGDGHSRTNDPIGVFTARYIYQKVQLSYLMHDIWTYLYDEDSPDESRFEALLGDLDAWHDETRKVLKAASLTEQPFSTKDDVESMKVGLRAIDFHYAYLMAVLTKGSAEHQELCHETSKLLLSDLKQLRCLPQQPYQPFLWQLLCCPFTPFLVLFRSIITFTQDDAMDVQGSLNAMRQLPEYLEHAKSVTPLASKLQEVANVIVQYATTFIANQRTNGQQSTVTGSLPTPKHNFGIDASLPIGCDGSFDFNESMKLSNTCTDNFMSNDGGMFGWLNWDEVFDFTST